MDVIYYYYFLFYSKILKDDEPHLLTTMALSASFGFSLSSVFDILFIRFFCYETNKWFMISIIVFSNLISYLYFHKTKRALKLIQQKPKFFSNHKLSVILVLLFFITTLSFLFWSPVYTKYLLETYCNK